MALNAPPPVVLDLDFHSAQEEIFRNRARFRVAATGRRFGKTTLAVGELLVKAVEHPGSVCWWVAPVYQQSQIAFKMLLSMVPAEIREANRSDREVTLWNGSRVAFKSADRPDNLRGEGVEFLVLDEAAYIKEETWTAALRPTLSDTMGGALLVSTFRGENWFYDAYQRGVEDGFDEWAGFRFTTLDNPHIDPTEVDEARRTLPKDVYEQEYMANPLVYVGAVFPGEKVQAATERPVAWREDLPAYAGLDWGYSNATAFEVCQEDSEGRVSWLHEHLWVATQLDTRIAHIVETCRERRIEAIYADAAGATENAALADALDRTGLPTELVAVAFGRHKDGGIKTRRWYLENDLEAMGAGVPELMRTTKRYRYKEGSEDVEKVDDHPVDAVTAFYASRRGRLVER